MAVPVASGGVVVGGLGRLRRALAASSATLNSEVGEAMREAGELVSERAKQNAPRRTGDLQASIKSTATKSSASVYSSLPYAPVHEYGGTISPKGTPITIPRREYMGRGVEQSRRQLDATMLAVLEKIARTYQFL